MYMKDVSICMYVYQVHKLLSHCGYNRSIHIITYMYHREPRTGGFITILIEIPNLSLVVMLLLLFSVQH